VASVAEEKYPDGNLGVAVSGFEYNGTVYNDDLLQDFTPDPNTGIADPNIINDFNGTPWGGVPTVTLNPDATGVISSFNVKTYVPDVGAVLYMDFNYGNTSNSEQHILYRTLSSAAGTKFTNSNTTANTYTYLNVDINDLPAGNYYWSAIARNDFGGATSNVSNLFFWPGAGINEANIIDANGVFSNGNVLTSNNAIANLSVGANVYLLSGNGQLANNTYITVINSTTPTANFEVTPTPIVALNNATIQVIRGGINGNAIVPNTMPGNRVTPNTLSGNTVIANTMNGNVLINGTVNGNVLITGTVNGNVVIANTLNGNTIIANTVNGNRIIANTLYGNTIIANTVNGNTIIANTLNGNTIIANTLNGDTITANTVNGNRIIANTLNGNTILANTVNGNTIIANTLNGNSITANTLNGNTIIANTINGNTFIANTLNGNTIIANTMNGNVIIANTLNGNSIISNTINGNSIIANTINGNSIIANTINGNSIIANTINGNSIIANTINGNSIIANTINGNTIIANTIDGNKIIGNTVNGNVIIANTLNGNSIQAFSINGGVAFIAGTIQAQAIAANTITFENLAIGSVTQSKSTISDPIVQPVPFTNISNAWPDNTRSVIPSGGVTIIPSTDPQSSANTEYTEGSRIQVSWSVKMYVDDGGANLWSDYNLIEIWKSGASSVFDRGVNTIRVAYNPVYTATNVTEQLHAFGYSPAGIDLFSQDGGNSWSVYNGNSTNKTVTCAYSDRLNANSTIYIDTAAFGPLQASDTLANSLPYVSMGDRSGGGAGAQTALQWQLDNVSANKGLAYQTSNGGTITYNYQGSFLSCEATPTTYKMVGSPSVGTVAGYILTGTNGDIFYQDDGRVTGPTSTAAGSAFARENVPNLIKDLYSSYSNPMASNNYTAVICGQQGTLLRSSRTFGASDYGNSWTGKSTFIQGDNTQPVLTDFYSVAGDDTSPTGSTSEWVTVGQYGMVQYSNDDGDNWDQVFLGNTFTADLNGIRHGNGKWVACGDNGTIIISNDAGNANAWLQIDTSNLQYTNGATYGSILDRQLNTVCYLPNNDTMTIGGQGIILYSNNFSSTSAANVVFKVAYEEAPSETYDLTRVTYYGSWPNVANVSRPPAEQKILNNQIFSGTILDTGYVAGQETTYYLVIGNMAGKQVLAGQIFLQVQEIKR
jgi:hypothetical protein